MPTQQVSLQEMTSQPMTVVKDSTAMKCFVSASNLFIKIITIFVVFSPQASALINSLSKPQSTDNGTPHYS